MREFAEPAAKSSPNISCWKRQDWMRKFTRKELSRYNGRAGAPAYVAYRGKVYDVTEALLWKGGCHQVLHNAGQDLTDALDREAPHGPELLERYPQVAELESE